MFANIKYQKFIKCFMKEFPNKTLEDAKTEWIKFRSAEILTMTEYGYGNNLEKQKKFMIISIINIIGFIKIKI